ncbi:4-hydroxythreonine-4-phosphate dehydrogenase PdxA [Marinobacter salarius]|uniref:PdxA family dehydrogenase n=1 Tax=Marinobacter salarius TaxID=1420917 RepID=UPI00273CDCF1|nr:4-hydroxythreonine-4-phosphate dehydrogenase PdxA [Marinobacter salarius]MDP4533512.1 4-hydroxythreonine-4-phosphate dehydrogenase PdxA [Marinobacter salarius]
MSRSTNLPIVAIAIGDPAGIGPEVTVKALLDPSVYELCCPVVVGSSQVIKNTLSLLKKNIEIREIGATSDLDAASKTINVIDPEYFDFSDVVYGRDSITGGAASGVWLDYACGLASEGDVDAVVMGPISSESMRMASTLDSLPTEKESEPAYLFLRSGNLMIMHLNDHVDYVDVPARITFEKVRNGISLLKESLKKWGYPNPRIGVAGLNPHAKGKIEEEVLTPAIENAREGGCAVVGPVSPDSVFRQCIDGDFDAVVALYHDQGHIALKTWGFSGNSVVFLGPSYLITTVAHGVAYEIAGKGIADHTMLRNSIINAGSLTTGKGFIS